MKLATVPVNPRVAAAAAGRRTEQQARYSRLLRNIHDRRKRGQKTARINLGDLEALIAVAAATDLAFSSGAVVPAVQP